jgi:CDP-diacylglycerol--glycerol-3-phosphate 3-phosphatidyltransferase
MIITDWLTLSRILLLPLALLPVTLGWNEGWLWSASFALLAGLSNIADDILARLSKRPSRYGAALDLVSDKIFICGMLIGLFALDAIAFWIPLVVVCREGVIMHLRNRHTGSPALATDNWGRLKIAVSYTAVCWVTLYQSLHTGQVLAGLNFSWLDGLLSVSDWIMPAAVVLTLVSGLHYLWRYLRRRPTAAEG